MDKEKFIQKYIENEDISNKMRSDAQDYLEMKAVSYAYKKLLKHINKKMVKSKRAYPGKSSDKILLVLGYNLFNLMEQYHEFRYSRLDAGERNAVRDMMLWGMPILVSCKKDVLDIVCPGRELSFGFDPTPGRGGLYNPLVDMDKLIEELPGDGKGDLDEKSINS